MKKFFITIFILLKLSLFIGAESINLTIDDAVEMSISRNLSLKQAGIALKTAENTKKNAWNAFLPSLSASSTLSANHGIFTFNNREPKSLEEPGNTGLSVGANLLLPVNLAVFSGFEKLNHDYEAELLEYKSAIKQLEKNVRQQFYGLLTKEENIRIQEANINLAQKRYEQALHNFENGLTPELDVFSTKVALSNLQPAYNDAIVSYNSDLLLFKILIGANRTDEISLIGELSPQFYNLDAEVLIEKYIAGRLDLRNIDKQILAMEASQKVLMLNSNTPTLSLGYNYTLAGTNTETDPFTLQAVDPWTSFNDNGTLSLGLQWKFDGLIPGSSTYVQIEALQDGIDTLRISRTMARNNAETEIANLVSQLLTAHLTIEANLSSSDLAKKNLELTEEAYNLGTRQLLDVQSAQIDYMLSQQQLLLAKYQYIVGLLNLEYALNTPLEELIKE